MTRCPANRSARKTIPCSDPFVTSTRAGSTPWRSEIQLRSGWYPPAGPYESTVGPSRSRAARAQSASSSTGRHSGAGTPRANEIVSTPRGYRPRWSSDPVSDEGGIDGSHGAGAHGAADGDHRAVDEGVLDGDRDRDELHRELHESRRRPRAGDHRGASGGHPGGAGARTAVR